MIQGTISTIGTFSCLNNVLSSHKFDQMTTKLFKKTKVLDKVYRILCLFCFLKTLRKSLSNTT